MKPDLDTLRPIPWHPGSVLLMADLEWGDGKDVVASPRQILRRQLARLAERGLVANAGTELEFIVFKDTYEDAWKQGATATSSRPTSTTTTTRCSAAPGSSRSCGGSATRWRGAGMSVENSKGECNLGQHEINFHYGEALEVADDHAIYKNGAKEIAAQEGIRDHLHGEVRRARGQLVPHPLLARRRGGRQRLRRRPPDVRPLRRGPACRPPRADAALRPARQLVQALRRGVVRADRCRLGQRQPHVLDARRRPRRGPAGREPASGRRRQPLPCAGRDDRRRPAGIDSELPLEPPTGGQRLHLRQAARAAQPLRRARPLRAAGSRARRSARRSWTTT